MASGGGESNDEECENIRDTTCISSGQWAHFVDHRRVPDLWNPDMALSYRVLLELVQGIEVKGEPHSTLTELILLLKPDTNKQQIPQYVNIRRKLNSKSINLEETVPWTISGPQSLGPESKCVGLTDFHLDGSTMEPFPRCPILSNGLILEMRRHWWRKHYTWSVFTKWVSQLTSGDYQPKEYILRKRVTKIHQQHLKLITGQNSTKLQSFLRSTFHETVSEKGSHDQSDKSPRSAAESTAPEEKQQGDTGMPEECNTLDGIASALDGVAGALNASANPHALETCRQELTLFRQAFREFKYNGNRRIHRRDRKLVDQGNSIHHLREDVCTLQSKITALKKKYESIRNSKNYYVKRCSLLEEERQEHKVHVNSTMAALVQSQEEVTRLEEQIHMIVSDKLHIDTKVDGRFTDNVRQTVMGLCSLGVSSRNIVEVIKVVAEGLCGVELAELPSSSTIKNFFMEANIIGKLQVCDILFSQTNNTLHVDGTTYHQRHFLGYQVSTQGGSYAMAMPETQRGDADTQLAGLQGMVKELALLVSPDQEEATNLSSQMILSFKNIMTDQHIVNRKFKEDFEALRSSILERSEQRWEQLSDTEKEDMVRLNQWYCFMHVLLGLADATEAALKDYEEIITVHHTLPLGRGKGKSAATGSSAVVECLRAVCALLTSSGHPAAGLSQDFQAWLAQRMEKNQLVKFEHNRFNVLFENAAAVWFHRNHIQQFLSEHQNTNQLTEAVREDIQDGTLLACIRGVGIFHAIITAPFHGLALSKSTKHIMDLNPQLVSLQAKLEQISQNPYTVLDDGGAKWVVGIGEGGSLPNEILPSSRDEDNMDITMEVLSIVATHCLVTFTRQVSMQLPGGIHGEEKAGLRVGSASVPTSNCIGESQFALLKHLRNHKPNAQLETLEGTIMWAYNRTSNWLNGLADEDKEQIFDTARRRTPEFITTCKTRKQLLRALRIAAMKGKEEAERQPLQRSAVTKQKALQDVEESGGQIRLLEDVDALLYKHPNEKERVSALKDHIRFYKTVIQSPCVEKSLYLFSQKGRQFDSTKLAQNLKSIIRIHNTYIQETPSTSSTAFPDTPTRLSQLQTVKKAVLCNYSKNPVSSTSQTCRRGSKRAGVFPDPCGKRVSHRWKVGKRYRWYNGTVLAVCSPTNTPTYSEDEEGNQATEYTLYNVKYDGEDDAYKLRLEKDWFRGDIEFLDW